SGLSVLLRDTMVASVLPTRLRPPRRSNLPLSRSGSSYTWTSCQVGVTITLPCKADVDPNSTPYVQWLTQSETVFERKGREGFPGVGYEGRADVPLPLLEDGNCSLHLTDVRLSDAGFYQSFLVVGKANIKQKILLQSVQLAVTDHKHSATVQRGQDMEVPLHSSQAVRLVFQGLQSPEWTTLWSKGGAKDSRLSEWPGALVLKGVRDGDEGIYRVQDDQGLALSTVRLTVTDNKGSATVPRASCIGLLLFCAILHPT
uniref:Ig-like domain-containing protein n=1 Tax=Denticeps clupeoides TaxID=299321 RepID=A0AAY4D2J2_9TELE